MTTPIYVNLNYRQYKEFEGQFAQGISPLESEHKTEDRRFYHKAVRFVVGDLEFEVVGPPVMAPGLNPDHAHIEVRPSQEEQNR